MAKKIKTRRPPALQRRIEATKAYADLYEGFEGTPQERISEVMAYTGVAEVTVRSMLKRWWGLEEYRRRIGKADTPRNGRHQPQVAAKKYAEGRGAFATRVTRVAKSLGVGKDQVRKLLQEYWGIREYLKHSGGYERSVFPVDREELVQILNAGDLWRSRRAINTVVRQLGVLPATLKIRMHRWRIVRGPYVLDPSKKGKNRGGDNETPRIRTDTYAEMFGQYSGSPQERVRRIAVALGVDELTVARGLKRCWGVKKFRRVLGGRRSRLGRDPEDYGEAFTALSGSPEARIRILADQFEVAEGTVMTRLRECWGLEEYGRRIGPTRQPFPVERDELIELLNRDELWKVGQGRRAVAETLGVSMSTLVGKMSYWGVIRGPYIVVD